MNTKLAQMAILCSHPLNASAPHLLFICCDIVKKTNEKYTSKSNYFTVS